MSMLAERKRKQKWSLNPRGNDWSQDASKFGQKMLEKMGWQHGKGLGPKGDGITEHVKVSYKNDSKGMGYKESNDQWTEHESNFTELLKNLSGEVDATDKIKVSSLEQKSQTSRARVHYHKFTRGKDLSRYSEKDLANIFGKKSLKDLNKKELEIKKEDSNSKENEDNSEFLVNAGSMKDYFKKKLSGFGKMNGYVIGNNGVLKTEESESENELRPSFHLGFNNNSNVENGQKESESETEPRPSFGLGFKDSSKESKKKSSFVSYIGENGDKRKADDIDTIVLSPKKKSKKVEPTEEKELGLSNPAFNPMSTPIKIQKHHLDTIEESKKEELDDSLLVSPKKKNKKQVSVPECTVETTEDTNVELSLQESSKKKNKLNKTLEFSNPSFTEEMINEEISTEVNSYEVIRNKSKKSKKKRKKLEVLGNIDNEATMEPRINSSESEDKSTNVKTKSKKKDKCLYIDNINFEGGDSSANFSQIEENPYEVKVKKKKQKQKNVDIDNSNFERVEANVDKRLEIDNPNFDPTDVSTDSLQAKDNIYEVKIKSKKHKSKLEIVNPSFDETEDSSINLTQTEENPFEVKVKNKKSKKTVVDTNLEPTENTVASHKLKKKKAKKLDNPVCQDDLEKPIDTINPYEIKLNREKHKTKPVAGIANPAIELNDSKIEENTLEEFDLMLNVVSTPIVAREDTSTVSVGSVRKMENFKNRKSVTFSDVTQELIIPNNDELREMYVKKDKSKKKKKGLDNVNFDKQKTSLDENVDSISKTLDTYQAEIENDINEEKMKTVTVDDLMVGEVGNPHGENEKLPEGTKLKFKYANLESRTPFYQLDKIGARKSYKHLIKGDILLNFKNTNLHEIIGYGAKVYSGWKLCPVQTAASGTVQYVCYMNEKCCEQGCCPIYNYKHLQSWYFWILLFIVCSLFYSCSWYCKRLEDSRRKRLQRLAQAARPVSQNVSPRRTDTAYLMENSEFDKKEVNKEEFEPPPEYNEAIVMPASPFIQIHQTMHGDNGNDAMVGPSVSNTVPPSYEDVAECYGHGKRT